MWGCNIKKNLFFSSILSYFQSLVLYDNNVYGSKLFTSNMTYYRQFMTNKIQLDINRTIDINNNLTYLINTFDSNVSFLYNNQTVPTKNLQTNLTISYEYESLSYIENYIILKISKLLNQTNLIFTNNMD